MNFDPQTHPHGDLTEKIIGAAMSVHSALGPGLDESIYENALCRELSHLGMYFEQQKRFPVHYRGKIVGTMITDLIIEQKVLVELKVADAFHDLHMAQTLSYLSITKLPLALMLNFKPISLGVKRVANIYLKKSV